MNSLWRRRIHLLGIIVPLSLCSIVYAQTPGTQSSAAAGGLKILVLEGQGAVNNTRTHKGTPPVVEVRDENDRPVEGATVVFRLPAAGPGGYFLNQELSSSVRTTIQGQATPNGFFPNDEAGRFKIHVTATAGNRSGEADIAQTNSTTSFATEAPPPPRKLGVWKWVIIGAAAATAVGIVLLTRSGSSTSSTTSTGSPTITITSGPITIGGH